VRLWHTRKLRAGRRGRQKLDLHPRCPRAYHSEPPRRLGGEIEDPTALAGSPISHPDPDRVPIGQVRDDRPRAEGRCPMRRGQLMPIIAFSAAVGRPCQRLPYQDARPICTREGDKDGGPAVAERGPSATGRARASEPSG
jgi:hypothetical protein